MSDCESSDSSVEELDIKPVRPAPRARGRQQNGVSPARSLSPNSVLNCSGDAASIKRCIDNYSSISSSASQFPSVIPLNVGGIKYVTRLSTLKKYPDSMLAALFSGRYQVDKDADGNFFLDSNGILFGYLLEFLRNGLVPPREQSVQLYREASYYGLHELVEKLQLMPPVVALCVKEAHKSQFPNYDEIKENVIKIAMDNATFTKIGEVIIYAFKTEFVPKVNTFNPNHGCIVESASITCGPWEAPVEEEVFLKCLVNDLIDDGFDAKNEPKKKCRYYHGQSCPKFVYRLMIMF